jgi:hypothetical protein
MKVEVTYATEFGCSESIMYLEELPSFVKNFTIFNVVPYNSTSLDENAIEFGKWLNNQVLNKKGSHSHLHNKMRVSELYIVYKKEKNL